jgi:flagellar biosynthetic protein FlhB
MTLLLRPSRPHFSAQIIDLQWFAAEDEGRTEEPTERRLRRAREEEGRVPKSQDIVSALGLLLPALTLFFLAPSMLNTCVEMLRFYFSRSVELDPTKDGIVAGAFLTYFARLTLPIACVALVTAIFSNVVQTGFMFTPKKIVPDFSKIVPRLGQYFSKTLFSSQGVFNFAKSLLKMVLIGIMAFLLISADIQKLTNLQTATLWMGITTVASLAIRLLIFSALMLLVLSIPDFLFQRWQFREQMRMKREEVTREYKEDYGDPQIKSRLQRRMQQLLQSNLKAVPQASVVITNPTHLAIALQWKAGFRAPRVLAKGEDDIALTIRRIARENNVPIVEDKPLARAMYPMVQINEDIPEQFWQAVVLILRKILYMDRGRQ